MLDLEERRAREEGGRPDPQILLLYARAMAADGTTRAPDRLGGPGVRFRYEAAIAALEAIADVASTRDEARRLFHDVCLHYADVLASLDRTALATLAYARAVALGGERGEAAEHASWLARRLRSEEADAQKRVTSATQGSGNLPDALVALAIAYCRQARFDEGKELFDKLERDLGPSPALRWHRAAHLLREQDRPRAIEELRRVVAEEPALAKASYDLAQLLEESGEFEEAVRAYDEAVRRTQAAAATTGAEEWAVDAVRRAEELERLLLREGAK
jgi:tetratricopeptide (TPR) repeat protein